VLPDSTVSFTFKDFDLKNLDRIAYRPLADEILVQQLRTEKKSFIAIRMSGIKQDRLEDYVVGDLIGRDEIDYDEHADLLYKLAGQVVSRLRSYLADDDEVERVLLDHANRIGDFVFQQMMDHYVETETTYKVTVQPGFFGLKGPNYNQPPGAPKLDFRSGVAPKSDTKKHVFQGFKRCCFMEQMFHSDDERRFAVLVDGATSVIRWAKPGRRQFMIEYRRGEQYEPDFVVETLTEKLICEVKARNEMEDVDVIAKARAARTWIGYANQHAKATGGKPWRYVLIPHDEIIGSSTLAGLVAKFDQSEIHGLAV
jgi:type III restriction enzyme